MQILVLPEVLFFIIGPFVCNACPVPVTEAGVYISPTPTSPRAARLAVPTWAWPLHPDSWLVEVAIAMGITELWQ